MKKLFLLIIALVLFVCVGCALKDPGSQYDLAPAPKFRMGDKNQLAALASGDMFLVEDVDDASKTKYTTLDDINTYLGSIYQPLTAYLTDLGDGNITSNFVNTTYPWAVNEGGTGAATFTDGGILLGSGTGAITALGVASNGQIPIGDGTTDPVLATITGTANEVTVTNGAGSTTLSLASGINATKIADGSVGNTEFQRIDGITDAGQTLISDGNITAQRTTLGAAASGANSDITSMSGLTTPLSVAQGGTGSDNATGAKTNLGAQPLEATLTDIADGTIAENLVNEAHPWTDDETSNTLTLDLLQLSILTSAPGSPSAGRIYFADNDTWDPCDIAGTNNYYCVYDGADYVAIMDEDGSFFISSVELPSFSHFATGDAVYSDNATPHVLTLEEMKGSVITNAGASQDKVYTCQPAGFGMNFMPMVIAAYQMDLEPDGNETLWLNGTQMDAGEHIQNTADTKGDIMSCWSVESGDGTYEIFCKSDNANWVEATP